MEQQKILFFVRGLGFGHAARDLAIAKQLSEMNDNTQIKFVSYAAGAKFLSGNSYNVIDLGLPATGNDGKMISHAIALISSEKPDIIVTDEELSITSIAKGFNIPCVLIANWFQPEDAQIVELFSDAGCIIIPDYKDGFNISLSPPLDPGKISWVGPIRTWNMDSTETREIARNNLGIDNSVKFLLLMCGHGDIMDIPFLEKSLAAYLLLDFPRQMVMLAGPFQKLFSYAERDGDNITVAEHLWDIERYMLASDLVITRGGHTSLWELAMMGVPSISIPRLKRISPMNIVYAENMQQRGTTLVIKDEELTPDSLREKINLILTDERLWRRMSRAGAKYSMSKGIYAAADVILSMAERTQQPDLAEQTL